MKVIFADLNVEETAEALQVSAETVARDWRAAKAGSIANWRVGATPNRGMPREDYERLIAVFTSACALAPGQRTAFLDEACAGDTELRRRIDAMVPADESPDGLLERPAVENCIPARHPGGSVPAGSPARGKAGWASCVSRTRHQALSAGRGEVSLRKPRERRRTAPFSTRGALPRAGRFFACGGNARPPVVRRTTSRLPQRTGYPHPSAAPASHRPPALRYDPNQAGGAQNPPAQPLHLRAAGLYFRHRLYFRLARRRARVYDQDTKDDPQTSKRAGGLPRSAGFRLRRATASWAVVDTFRTSAPDPEFSAGARTT